MWVRIRRIGIISAFKLGCFFSALPTLILLIIIVSALFSLVPAKAGYSPANVIVALPVLIAIAVMTAIGPAIALAIQAFFFNIFGALFGGVSVKLDKMVFDDESEEQRLVPASKKKTQSEDPLLEQMRKRREKMGL